MGAQQQVPSLLPGVRVRIAPTASGKCKYKLSHV